MVNEAVTSGVRWTSEPNFLNHVDIQNLWLFELPEDVYRDMKNYGMLMSGAPYPILENLGMLWQRLAKWFLRKDVANPWDAGERTIKCSEFFFRALFNHDESLDLWTIKNELLNNYGEYISGDIDSLGVRDTELVLDWLAFEGYCKRVDAIEPVQNSSAVTLFSDAA